MLFLSHVTSPTAIIFPVEALVKRARGAGVITVVDGAHAPGHVPLDLRALGVDFYAANCHKWLCAPKGSGFLYARPEMQSHLLPLVISWGWRSPHPGPSRFVDEREMQGTRDIAAFLSVPTAIEFVRAHDWPSVQRRAHALVADARRQISDLTGLPPLTPDSAEWYGQMAAFPLPTCDAAALSRALWEDHRIEVPLTSWAGQHFVRVSIQAYNNADDVAALVDALQVLLPSQ